jgi:hypothetical protein
VNSSGTVFITLVQYMFNYFAVFFLTLVMINVWLNTAVTQLTINPLKLTNY